MSRTKSKWKSEKTHVTFCSLSTKRSRFCILYLQGMKSEFILRISSTKKIMDRPRRTIHIDRKTESLWQKDDALRLVGPEERDLLKSGEIVNIKRYQHQLTDFNWRIGLIEKDQNTEIGNIKSFFFVTMLHHIRFATSTQLGSSTPWDLLTKHGSFRLSPVCIEGSRSCRAALWFAAKEEDFYSRGIHKLF